MAWPNEAIHREPARGAEDASSQYRTRSLLLATVSPAGGVAGALITGAICFLIDFAALLYAKGFKLLALDRERTPNTATSC